MTSTSKKQVRSDRARVVAEMRAAEARAERRRRLVLAGAVVAAVAWVTGRYWAGWESLVRAALRRPSASAG